MRSVRELVAGLIDFAGLFPPASLDMQAAVDRYAQHLEGPCAWALGRFVVPAGRLEEFERTRPGPWRLSALGGEDLRAELAAIRRFNARGGAIIDTIEIQARDPGQVRRAAGAIPGSLQRYFEIPMDGNCLEAVAAAGARAKVRTGGLSPEMFPPSVDVAGFLEACWRKGVPFKATAGLHHAVRSVHPFTYSPDSLKGLMHGFLNLFLASAFLMEGLRLEEVVEALEETAPDAFRFQDSTVTWRTHHLQADALRLARQSFAICFGSCSFQEPMEEMQALGLL